MTLLELHNLPTQPGTVSPALFLGFAVLFLLVKALCRVLYPTYDPREPPEVRPKIPVIGHALSIFLEGGSYYGRIYKSTGLPICTLPMPPASFSGAAGDNNNENSDRLYVISSSTLISAAQRSPTLSFDPFVVLFSRNALDASPDHVARLATDPAYLRAAKEPFYPSMSGRRLQAAVAVALESIAEDLNRLGRGNDHRGGGGGGGGGGERVIVIPDLGNWLREVISRAVVIALYGREHNPITQERLYDLWEFDRKITVLTLGLAPRLLATKAVTARERIQAALYEYYRAGHDQGPGVSAFVRDRAAAKRRMAVNAGLEAMAEDLARGEMDIPWTALTNTIPSLAWLFVHVFSRPDFAQRVREEVTEVSAVEVGSGGGVVRATIDVDRLSRQPFLSACLQEVQRLYNKLCGYRYVMEDTLLRDADGREYLLRKGATAQWFHGVPHLNEDIWGSDAGAFRPERFIDVPSGEEKRRRGSLMPFGGGKHLCPGRKFAVIEIVGLVGAVALLFDVDGVTVSPMRPGFAGCAMAHPDWSPNDPARATFRRRTGWENTQLRYIV